MPITTTRLATPATREQIDRLRADGWCADDILDLIVAEADYADDEYATWVDEECRRRGILARHGADAPPY